MMIKKPKRGRVGAKRLNPAELRKLVQDRRLWCCMAKVIKPDGQAQHFDLDGEDVYIEVETQPDLLDLTCRLSGSFGGPNIGIWSIPPVGAEVAILIPSGEIDFMPIVVGVMASGDLPDGVAENVTVIANAQVLVHDGNGGARELAFNDDLNALRDAYNGHQHQGGDSTPTSPPMTIVPGVNPPPNPSFPPTPPPFLPGTPDADLGAFAGTAILKGK